MAAEVQATIRLLIPHEVAIALVSSHWGELEPASTTSCLLRVGADDPTELARWLCVLPCDFEVLEPEAVRDALHERAHRLLEA